MPNWLKKGAVATQLCTCPCLQTLTCLVGIRPDLEDTLIPLLLCSSPRSSSLHFSFLSLDKHREWLEYLLEFAQDAAPIPNQYDKHFLERDYTGYVLALNGHKKYFCLFKPHRSGDEGGTPGSCEDYDSSLHAEARGKSSYSPGSRSIKNKLHKLSFWMERLLEGSLQRFYIPSWPALD